MLSGKKYDKYAWYDKLLISMSKKNARLQLQVNIFVLNCVPTFFVLKYVPSQHKYPLQTLRFYEI